MSDERGGLSERRGKPRVGFLTPLPTPYRQPLLELLAARDDVDVAVLYFAAGEPDRSWSVPIPDDRSHFRVLENRSMAFMGKKSFINHWNPGLIRELNQADFDLIVVPGYALLSSQAAIAWAWLRRKPYVVHSESHLRSPRAGWRRIIKEPVVRAAISRAWAGLATGTLSREYLRRYGARRVFFFPNTPDVNWFAANADALRPQREELRRRWGISSGPAVIYVGRFIHVKAVDTLIRAMKRVVAALPGAQLLLVGDGQERPALESLARELPPETIRFLGFQQGLDLVGLYVCADVFCLPSRDDPWGVVVNEAAACGLPLVVSDRVGAGADLVLPRINGEVAPADDVARLGDALEKTLRARAEFQRMAEESRRLAFAWGFGLALEQFGAMIAEFQKNRRDKVRKGTQSC